MKYVPFFATVIVELGRSNDMIRKEKELSIVRAILLSAFRQIVKIFYLLKELIVDISAFEYTKANIKEYLLVKASKFFDISINDVVNKKKSVLKKIRIKAKMMANQTKKSDQINESRFGRISFFRKKSNKIKTNYYRPPT